MAGWVDAVNPLHINGTAFITRVLLLLFIIIFIIIRCSDLHGTMWKGIFEILFPLQFFVVWAFVFSIVGAIRVLQKKPRRTIDTCSLWTSAFVLFRWAHGAHMESYKKQQTLRLHSTVEKSKWKYTWRMHMKSNARTTDYIVVPAEIYKISVSSFGRLQAHGLYFPPHSHANIHILADTSRHDQQQYRTFIKHINLFYPIHRVTAHYNHHCATPKQTRAERSWTTADTERT